MSVYKYKALLKVIELGSVSKAADALGYTQPGLSQILNSLEADFDMKLLMRERSGVHLTAAGEELLPLMKATCESEQTLRKKVAEIHNMNSGVIRVGVIISVATHVMPVLMAKFKEKHPNVTIKLFPGTFDEIETWVRRGQVDLGFILDPPKTDVEIIHLREDEIRVVMPRGHALAFCDEVPQNELLKYPYILFGRTNCEDFNRVEVFNQLRENAQYVAEDDYAILAMVEQGLGIALMPELILKRIPYDIVHKRLSPCAHRMISIALQSRKKRPPIVKDFLELAIEAKDSDSLWK